MKKLVFTALAVVAFSGVAMAKTEEVRMLNAEVVEKTKSDILDNICEERAVDSFEYIVAHYEVPNETALFNYLIGRCHPENKGKLTYPSY